jgi:diguanylate cyclase (GGDEF)-like protein
VEPDRTVRYDLMRGLLSRNNRYLTAIGGLAVLAVALVGATYASSESERARIQQADAVTTELRVAVSELVDALHDQEVAVAQYVLTQRPARLAAYEQARTQATETVALLQQLGASVPEIEASALAAIELSDDWQRGFARPAITAVERGDEALLAALLEAQAGEAELHAALEPLTAALEAEEASLVARSDALAFTRMLATAFGLAVMVASSGLALLLIRRYGRILERDAVQSSIVNRFTEVTSFATDDTAVARSNLDALALLVAPDAALTHVYNRSKDRAAPEAIRGDALAEVLPLNALARCAGMVRGSMYVTDDVAAPLSVRCPVYPVEKGTLACVPLNSGESVGAVHLYWKRPHALSLAARSGVVRIAEHAALAIGNRRLLAALHGQANTDPRTGLANSRAFDQALEEALTMRASDEAVSVLMLDLDHFKDFNDRYGHPAGDEALRAFGGVLSSCMREGDVASRYGGEEFAVLLAGVDTHDATVIAERIRARTEATLISLAPGISARITVSIGMAAAPAQASDRVSLLRIADEALYRAKEAGRNRVETLSPHLPAGVVAAAVTANGNGNARTPGKGETLGGDSPPEPERVPA